MECASDQHSHGALVLRPQSFVDKFVQARRIGQRNREEKRSQDSNCANAACSGGAPAKKVQPHESEFAAARALRKRNLKADNGGGKTAAKRGEMARERERMHSRRLARRPRIG